MLLSKVIHFILGEPLRRVCETLLQINSIDLFRHYNESSCCGQTFWPLTFISVLSQGHGEERDWGVYIHLVGSFSPTRSCLSAWQWARGQQGMLGYGNREETVLLWCLWLELLAEAAVPEPTLAEDTGNGEMGPLSYVITGTQTGECVFIYACVSMSVSNTDSGGTTVNPPAVCMICPILYPAALCKQQVSGPEDSHRQEVSTGVNELHGEEDFNSWWYISKFNSLKLHFNIYNNIRWKWNYLCGNSVNWCRRETSWVWVWCCVALVLLVCLWP